MFIRDKLKRYLKVESWWFWQIRDVIRLEWRADCWRWVSNSDFRAIDNLWGISEVKGIEGTYYSQLFDKAQYRFETERWFLKGLLIILWKCVLEDIYLNLEIS